MSRIFVRLAPLQQVFDISHSTSHSSPCKVRGRIANQVNRLIAHFEPGSKPFRSRSLPRPRVATQQDVGCPECSLPLVRREFCLFQRQLGWPCAMSMASTCAVCSHTDDAVGYVILGCVGLFPEGASRAPWVSSRGRGRPCRLPNAYGSLWSCSSCSGAQVPSAWTSQACKSVGESFLAQCRDAGACQHAQEPSPMLVAQWRHVPQCKRVCVSRHHL